MCRFCALASRYPGLGKQNLQRHQSQPSLSDLVRQKTDKSSTSNNLPSPQAN